MQLPTTPAQTEGPFFPVAFEPRGNDLTRRGAEKAVGEPVRIAGRVTDRAGRPLAGACLRLWQTDSRGSYDHPDAANRHPLDPGFGYWGETFSDAAGRYAFRTVRPGPYPVRPDWTRTPHVHFQVHHTAAPLLTTQLYFPDHPLNGADVIFNEVPPAGRALVTARPLDAAGDAGDVVAYAFDIVLG